MTEAINDVVTQAGWKLRTLLRTRRFYCDAEMVLLYKSHLVSFIEYRTSAVYHARRDVFSRLDAVQTRFLRDANVTVLHALVRFNLAPLAVRRAIAMLGLIHRTVLGFGPLHFQKFFKIDVNGTERRKHRYHLVDPRRSLSSQLLKRSALGLIAVNNLLPDVVVTQRTVSGFQSGLQRIVRERAEAGQEAWESTLSPRVSLGTHPLQTL